jgi:predicted NBD/HSP70 family sugar kinase
VFADPEVIVIGGGMMASADVILPALAERLKNVVPFPPDLVPAHFDENASLHGAIAIALDASAGKAAPCS